jgi:hypothetical protein
MGLQAASTPTSLSFSSLFSTLIFVGNDYINILIGRALLPRVQLSGI